MNILSANGNGLDQATWDNLEAMAEDKRYARDVPPGNRPEFSATPGMEDDSADSFAKDDQEEMALKTVVEHDHYSHAVVDKLLKPQTIDLKGRGRAFNNKGQRGCSDHDAYAVRLSLPKQ